jgi:hypothetical protein
VAYKHVHEDVPPPSLLEPGIPPYVDALVARATARDRELRPADARVLLQFVRRVRAAVDAGAADDPELTADLMPRVFFAAPSPPPVSTTSTTCRPGNSRRSRARPPASSARCLRHRSPRLPPRAVAGASPARSAPRRRRPDALRSETSAARATGAAAAVRSCSSWSWSWRFWRPARAGTSASAGTPPPPASSTCRVLRPSSASRRPG